MSDNRTVGDSVRRQHVRTQLDALYARELLSDERLAQMRQRAEFADRRELAEISEIVVRMLYFGR